MANIFEGFGKGFRKLKKSYREEKKIRDFFSSPDRKMPRRKRKNFWMYNLERPARSAVRGLESLLGGLNTKRKNLNKKIRSRYNRYARKVNAFREGK